MKVELVFLDWQKEGESILYTEEGVELSIGEFHPGTVFNAEIELEDGAITGEDFLRKALEAGYQPVFWLHCRKENE